MSFQSRIGIALKALCQLGLQPMALYGLYKVELATGHYRRMMDDERRRTDVRPSSLVFRLLFQFPSRADLIAILGAKGRATLLAEADEIVSGKVRLFGGEPMPLQLAFDEPLHHWTAYETGKAPLPTLDPRLPTPGSKPSNLPTCDFKLLWEPARFGWAFTLGRAYHLSGDEKYAEAFWRYAEQFLDGNPPYLGPHWMSGQEVALRLMAFVWAAQAFAASPVSTTERMARLANAIAQHASRIPPTLIYARSQNNNHLLTEAAGLYTAGLALQEHPQANKWRRLGWKWLNWGFQHQIDSYGEYSQHGTNYHRVMMQVALWENAIIRSNDLSRHYKWPRQTSDAIIRATHWLLSLLDPESGRAPNLGANDGAYIFPLTVCPFADYRPVLQAAGRAFIGYELPPGVWDEMCLWFGIPLASKKYVRSERYLGDHLYAKRSWAYLRTAQYTSRPSHADQLHLDLWWRGLNVAQDAGTYLYNAAPPWDNALTTTLVHNTVTVDGHEQMTRAGRFLYLDWVNAYSKSHLETDEHILQRVTARHYGYQRLGVLHVRTVTVYADERWLVDDQMLAARMFWVKTPLRYRLHWLLPDWGWKIENGDSRVGIELKSPYGWVTLGVSVLPRSSVSVSLVRAGELIYGEGDVPPTRGWASTTYNVKVPALSLAIEVTSVYDVKFTSEFTFPH